MGKLFIYYLLCHITLENGIITYSCVFFLHCIFSKHSIWHENATAQNVWSSSKTFSKALSQVHTTDVQNTTE